MHHVIFAKNAHVYLPTQYRRFTTAIIGKPVYEWVTVGPYFIFHSYSICLAFVTIRLWALLKGLFHPHGSVIGSKFLDKATKRLFLNRLSAKLLASKPSLSFSG